MTTIVRMLSQKRHWDNKQWLGTNDAQGDTTKCLLTKENKLSIFLLEEPSVQIERVVAALALNKENISNIDLAIAPEKVLATCGIDRDKVQANTPDIEVNEWHLDLVELTVNKIAKFATTIKREGEIKRYHEAYVKKAIQKSLNTDYIATAKISGNLIRSLKKRGVSFPNIS